MGASMNPAMMLACICINQASKLLEGPGGAHAPTILKVSVTTGSGIGVTPGIIPTYEIMTLVLAIKYSVIACATADIAALAEADE